MTARSKIINKKAKRNLILKMKQQENITPRCIVVKQMIKMDYFPVLEGFKKPRQATSRSP
jgi:hypothetical protein